MKPKQFHIVVAGIDQSHLRGLPDHIHRLGLEVTNFSTLCTAEE